MFNKYRKQCVAVCVGFFCMYLGAQEALKSYEEEYGNFLSLQGKTPRSSLNYRTLSDSVWQFKEDTSRYMISDQFTIKIYEPNLFSSFNSEIPYGQNDGLLWQGKGFNTSVTGGFRLEAYGIELTIKPQFAFSQNLSFDLMQSSYDSEYGYIWGYGNNKGVDAPQRFGNSPLFDWSFGDSEIRYSWRNMTAGFGTQSIWLGPAQINPLLHSNNAVPYPKFDIGLRRTAISLPFLDWYVGDVEFRVWTGYLTESDYFDSDDENDHNMLHGLALSYAPSFLPGLVLSANRTCLVKWKWENLSYIIPVEENTVEDQKMSVTASWLFPEVGFEVYGELGLDDYAAAGIKYPFHTMTYTFGLQKTMTLLTSFPLYGKLLFEWNNTEMSQDFQFQWPYNFGFHHEITQGYTNRGQWLGSGIGYGGNSQYLGYSVYHPKGSLMFFVHRFNPDNNFLYKDAKVPEVLDEAKYQRFIAWKTITSIGVKVETLILPNFRLHTGLSLAEVRNTMYTEKTKIKYNINASLGIKYLF